MNSSKRSSNQFELFPSKGNPQVHGSPSFKQYKSLTLSLENIIVMSIVFVVSLVVFYSFGFERGKASLAQVIEPHEVAQDSAGHYDIIVQPVQEPEIMKEAQAAQPQEVEDQKIEVLEIPLDQKMVEQRFTIQVASFKQETSAEKEATQLERKGHAAEVLRKGNYSIVCVGRFAERDQAKEYTAKLKSRYKDLLVRRL